MVDGGWGVEVLSWKHCLNRNLLKWTQNNSIFIALDDFYDSITFSSHLGTHFLYGYPPFLIRVCTLFLILVSSSHLAKVV